MPRKKTSKVKTSTKKSQEDKEDKKIEAVEKKQKKKQVYFAVGRRKTSIARVRLINENGPILVNKKPIEEYFPGEIAKIAYSEPFHTTDTFEKISGSIIVEGGGKSAQLQALILGVSRALLTLNPEFRSALRKKGFLTRDPRAKERKKPGLMGARKQKQSPKR